MTEDKAGEGGSDLITTHASSQCESTTTHHDFSFQAAWMPGMTSPK
ncbi:hypothetical protein [Xenorhabdus szentirmaii]|nr:hypothetical protein [Xenorhabdus szentirmaii]